MNNIDDKVAGASAQAQEAADRVAHSAAADKVKGHAKEAMGKVKEQIGSVIGDHQLEAEGTMQRAEGKKDRIKGEIKEKIDDVTEYAKAGVEVIKEKIDEIRHK